MLQGTFGRSPPSISPDMVFYAPAGNTTEDTGSSLAGYHKQNHRTNRLSGRSGLVATQREARMIGKENKMKKFVCLITAAMLLLSLAACGNSAPAATEPPVHETPTPSAAPSEAPAGETMGQALLADFREILSAEPEIGAEELANRLLKNPVIEFSGAAMPVEAGLMAGFGNTEISDFQEGAMFGPVIGSIPFVGYVFVLAADADADAFVQTLKDNADPRWNICTEADETVAERVDNYVFFVMCPA